MPFADFLARCRETRSVLDVVRRLEDTAEKPELEQQFFEDLKIWFDEFDKIKWTPPDLAAESIILLINKLIFARTVEDFGLVPYHYTQDEYTRQTKNLGSQGRAPHRPEVSRRSLRISSTNTTTPKSFPPASGTGWTRTRPTSSGFAKS